MTIRGKNKQEIRAKRLRELKQTATYEEMAQRIGANPAYLSQIGNEVIGRGRKSPRALSDDYASRLESAFRLPNGWFDMPNDGAQEPPNIEPGPEIRGRVPLISWVQAGNFSETIDVFAPGVADEWVETITPVRAHTYALRVQGDSMMPMFAPGAILIVEPDMEPLPGDFVIAKNGEEATFKQLIKDGDDWLLKPMNERYPIKPLGNGRIVGVVRDVMMHLR